LKNLVARMFCRTAEPTGLALTVAVKVYIRTLQAYGLLLRALSLIPYNPPNFQPFITPAPRHYWGFRPNSADLYHQKGKELVPPYTFCYGGEH